MKNVFFAFIAFSALPALATERPTLQCFTSERNQMVSQTLDADGNSSLIMEQGEYKIGVSVAKGEIVHATLEDTRTKARSIAGLLPGGSKNFTLSLYQGEDRDNSLLCRIR